MSNVVKTQCLKCRTPVSTIATPSPSRGGDHLVIAHAAARLRDPEGMQRLSGLGRQLRDAQTGLSRTEMRQLAEQRRQLITDLLQRARAYAAEADFRLTPTVLSEVEATLQAALVDLAGAMTIRNGRLVRPLSHIGFGPRPRAAVRRIAERDAERAKEVPIHDAVETPGAYVEDELAAARRRRNSAERWTVEAVESADPVLATEPEPQVRRQLRVAEEELALAEAAHWQSEFELADAEAAVEMAEDMLSTLDTKRMEARRDKVTAQRHFAEAQAQQRLAVNALADARQRLDEARRQAGEDD